MFKALLFLVFPLFLLASESILDLQIGVNPANAKNKSYVGITSQTSFDTIYGSLLFNPEVSFYLDKSVDFSFSCGHRWKLAGGAIGQHFFFDRCQLPNLSVNQVGTGVDYVTDLFTVKLNYYHPVTGPVDFLGTKIFPCRWAELEGCFKTRYFNFSLVPNYNIETTVPGLQAKFVVPFNRFSLGLGGFCDLMGNKQAFFSTNFHLYKLPTPQRVNSVHSHAKQPILFSKAKVLPPLVKTKNLPPPEEVKGNETIIPNPAEEPLNDSDVLVALEPPVVTEEVLIPQEPVDIDQVNIPVVSTEVISHPVKKDPPPPGWTDWLFPH